MTTYTIDKTLRDKLIAICYTSAGADVYTELFNIKAAPITSLTNAEIRGWWASENGLEDFDMSKVDDFAQVVRAIEAKIKGGA